MEIIYTTSVGTSKGGENKTTVDNILTNIITSSIYFASRPLYEIFDTTTNEYVRPFFDLDCERVEGEDLDENEVLEKAIIYISQILGIDKTKVEYCNACGDKKISYHLIVPDYKVKYADLIQLKDENEEDYSKHKLDRAVYRTYSKYRIIGTTKEAGKVQLRLRNDLEDKIATLNLDAIQPDDNDETDLNHLSAEHKRWIIALRKQYKRHLVSYVEGLPELKINLTHCGKKKKGMNFDISLSGKKIEIDEDSEEIYNPYSQPNFYTTDNLITILSNLKEFRSRDYDDWLRIGMILKSYGEKYKKPEKEMFEVWDKWSSKDKKYKGSGDLSSKWNGFNKKRLNITTLLMWFKQDNPNEYLKFIKSFDVVANFCLMNDF